MPASPVPAAGVAPAAGEGTAPDVVAGDFAPGVTSAGFGAGSRLTGSGCGFFTGGGFFSVFFFFFFSGGGGGGASGSGRGVAADAGSGRWSPGGEGAAGGRSTSTPGRTSSHDGAAATSPRIRRLRKQGHHAGQAGSKGVGKAEPDTDHVQPPRVAGGVGWITRPTWLIPPLRHWSITYMTRPYGMVSSARR